MTKRYNLKNIRALLAEGFTVEDLRRLCFDTPEFRHIYNQVTENTSKTKIIDQLIEYADLKLEIDTLLALAKEYSPARYEKHKPYYGVPEKPEGIIRVVVVDDHAVVRAGLRALFAIEPSIKVVGEAKDGEEALRLVAELTPDVLVLDIHMPGPLDGVEVARQLQAAGAPVGILALSSFVEKEYVLKILASGANGYLVKDAPPEEIIEAVRGAARGEHGWISRRVAAQLVSWTREDLDKLSLTDRERKILRLVVAGKTDEEISLALNITKKTVGKHLYRIFTKLDVSTRVEAAVKAVRTELV